MGDALISHLVLKKEMSDSGSVFSGYDVQLANLLTVQKMDKWVYSNTCNLDIIEIFEILLILLPFLFFAYTFILFSNFMKFHDYIRG